MPPHRRVSIRDVAAAASVSPSTVSRALRGDERISPETSERVRAAATALGYHPSLTAQELVRGRSRTIGVLIRHFMSTYFAEILTGIEQSVAGTPYDLLVVSSNGILGGEGPKLELLEGRRVDGIIVVQAALSDEELLASVGHDLPLVCVGRVSPTDPAASILIDNRAAARKLVEHLIGLGHERIA